MFTSPRNDQLRVYRGKENFYAIVSNNEQQHKTIEASGKDDGELLLFFITSITHRDKGFKIEWEVQTLQK